MHSAGADAFVCKLMGWCVSVMTGGARLVAGVGARLVAGVPDGACTTEGASKSLSLLLCSLYEYEYDGGDAGVELR